MTALAERPFVGRVTRLAEVRDRELYWRALAALARHGKVPAIRPLRSYSVMRLASSCSSR